jgi:hypothetical protein
MGAVSLKKGAMTPLSRKKGVSAKKIIPKCTDQVFLQYQFGKYQEIPTEYQPKIQNWYTTLIASPARAYLDKKCNRSRGRLSID